MCTVCTHLKAVFNLFETFLKKSLLFFKSCFDFKYPVHTVHIATGHVFTDILPF